jgi:protein phosphatase 4 regulatory subunit 3
VPLTTVFLNDTDIIGSVIQDDTFPIVVGILEYDKEFPTLKANFRDHITNHAHFKQVVPIEDPEIVAKIKQTYRIQFLRDVALARLIPDNTYSTLHSLLYFNQVDIITHIYNNTQFLSSLFAILGEDDSSMEKKKDVIMFLNEMCLVVKGLQKNHQVPYYKYFILNARALGEHGLFALFEYALNDPDEAIRTATISILANVLDHDPSVVRSFCLSQESENQRPLIEFMIEQFQTEVDEGILSQDADLIKLLLDTTGLGIDVSQFNVRVL